MEWGGSKGSPLLLFPQPPQRINITFGIANCLNNPWCWRQILIIFPERVSISNPHAPARRTHDKGRSFGLEYLNSTICEISINLLAVQTWLADPTQFQWVNIDKPASTFSTWDECRPCRFIDAIRDWMFVHAGPQMRFDL